MTGRAKTQASGGFPRLRWLVFCIVFFGIPVLLVAAWFGRLWEDRTAARQERRLQTMEDSLETATRWMTTEEFMEALLSQLGKDFRRLPAGRLTFRRRLASIKKRFAGVLEFVFVDPRGRCIRAWSDTDPPKAVLRKFWEVYRRREDGDQGPLKASWNLLKNYFGLLVHPKDVRRFHCTPAFFDKTRSQVLFSDVSPAGMFFVFFNEVPVWETLPVRDLVHWHNRRTPDRPIALLSLDRGGRDSIIPPPFTEDGLRRALLGFEGIPGKVLLQDNRWWLQKVVGPNTRLLTSVPVEEDEDVREERRLVVGTLTLAFAGLSWIALRLMLGGGGFFFSLRYKLVLLFLYIVGLPLLIMGITASGYLTELRIRLENRVFAEVEEALRTYDRNFPLILGLIESTIRNKVLAPGPGPEDLRTRTLARMGAYQGRFQGSTALLLDGDGKFHRPAGQEETDREGLKVASPVYRGVLQSLQSSSRTDFRNVEKTSAAEMVTGALGIDLEAFFAEAVKSVGKLRTIQLGARLTVQGLFPVTDARGFPVFLALFQWGHPALQHAYHRHYLTRLERRLTSTSLFALSRMSARDRNRTPEPRRDHPVNFRHLDLVFPLYDLFRSAGKNLQIKRQYRGRTWLITMVKGVQNFEYHLVGVTSDRVVTEEIDRVKDTFRLISAALLLMALTVGSLVARKFLEPVGHLAAGVQAVKEKNFDARIPVTERDELGELSLTFNQMIESLHEVSLGQQVQEQLFPHAKLVLGQYQVRGISRTATGVGGDYFEYIAVGDRHLMVLVGDATGHGVPAALVMAMAKAVVLQCAQQADIGGRQILETLNRIIFQGMNRKRLMTAALLWVDTRDHRIEFWNGGHPFPIKRFADGRMEMVAASGAPLGMRLKIVLNPGLTTLEPGERLFLYTDGLVESFPEQPPRTNFDQFQEYLGSRPILPLEEACEDILDHHCHIITGLPLPDDFTIVILERTGGGVGITTA